jgi:hypothetical protein
MLTFKHIAAGIQLGCLGYTCLKTPWQYQVLGQLACTAIGLCLFGISNCMKGKQQHNNPLKIGAGLYGLGLSFLSPVHSLWKNQLHGISVASPIKNDLIGTWMCFGYLAISFLPYLNKIPMLCTAAMLASKVLWDRKGVINTINEIGDNFIKTCTFIPGLFIGKVSSRFASKYLNREQEEVQKQESTFLGF